MQSIPDLFVGARIYPAWLIEVDSGERGREKIASMQAPSH